MDGRKNIQAWAAYLRSLREFFDSRGYTEVVTDHLVPAGAFESCLDTLKVHWGDGQGELHTSPEIEMKAILSSNPQAIYQICQCFRDDPSTGIHRREFTMLEFYSVGESYLQMIDLMKQLITEVNGGPPAFQQLTFVQLFKKYAGVDLNADSVAEMGKKAGIALSGNETEDDVLFKLLVEKIEPAIDPEVATIVTDYPLSMCALAKVDPVRQITERFEIYWKRMEICNGCSELTSYEELMERSSIEDERRKSEGKDPHPVSERLANSLKKGLPECAGVAVGLDRLFRCVN